MKNNKLQLLLAGLFLFAAGVPAFAREKAGEEKKLESSARELDRSAAKPEGQQRVLAMIKADFDVNDARVQGLRDRGMGYGEISIALSLARELPGGITEENVLKIAALRQGPPVMGWGNIAKNIGVKLGAVQQGVHKMGEHARKQDKDARLEKEKGEKGGKAERTGLPEKPEKIEKPERPEKPEKGGAH
ncbi:MAG: hypothetical protein NTY45_16030 [Elusimicrobia bacterium]|nr:hypothetical protein [Elusimicrobiota bacterium]